MDEPLDDFNFDDDVCDECGHQKDFWEECENCAISRPENARCRVCGWEGSRAELNERPDEPPLCPICDHAGIYFY